MNRLLLLVLLAPAQEKAGKIAGKISPEVHITIVAKLKGTDASKKENVKGSVELKEGGAFTIPGLQPGTYDLLFTLQGESAKKYHAFRWSRIEVTAGETTSGINYRLTPAGAGEEIDTLIVGFGKTAEADALKIIKDLGCILKDEPLKIGEARFYTVDIPDDKSAAEMIAAFKAKKEVSSAEANGIVSVK